MTTTTSATHTPGPWTHNATAGDHDFAVYPEATGRDVALVRDFNEANARLIAAAPELLRCLTGLTGLAAMRPGHLQDYKAAVIEARAAIAKATGGD